MRTLHEHAREAGKNHRDQSAVRCSLSHANQIIAIRVYRDSAPVIVGIQFRDDRLDFSRERMRMISRYKRDREKIYL